MHRGYDLNGGHYYVFVHSPEDSSWIVLDDHRVHCVPESVVTGLEVFDPTSVPCASNFLFFISFNRVVGKMRQEEKAKSKLTSITGVFVCILVLLRIL